MKTRIYAVPAVEGLKNTITTKCMRFISGRESYIIHCNNVVFSSCFGQESSNALSLRGAVLSQYTRDVDLLLGQRRKRWPNIKLPLSERLMFATIVYNIDDKWQHSGSLLSILERKAKRQ